MDDIEFMLIKGLRENSRATYRELADGLGLSVNSVHKRVQALIDGDVIRKFTVFLTPRALPSVVVRVCGRSDTSSIDETIRRLSKNAGTSRVVVSSGNSLHVVGMLDDISAISKFADFAIREGQIADPTVRLIDSPELHGRSAVPMTDTDYRIVASLQGNCRKQIVDVAKELDISPKTVRRRLKRMEDNGLVHYEVHYDHASLGGIFTLLDLYLKRGADVRQVSALIRNKYSKNLMEIRTFSTLPNDMTIDVWTQTMTELKALQDSLQNEDVLEKIVPYIEYNVYYFDSWRERHVREKGSIKE